jgi:hypothetical protein
MMDYFRILLSQRQSLLTSTDLPRLCRLAIYCNGVCAVICIVSFLLMLAVVIGYRMLPFRAVPVLIAAFFITFVISAMLASRFGRLTDAEKNVEYSNRILHLVDINPECKRYYQKIKSESRPVTRLDLDELGAIHIRTYKKQQR